MLEAGMVVSLGRLLPPLLLFSSSPVCSPAVAPIALLALFVLVGGFVGVLGAGLALVKALGYLRGITLGILLSSSQTGSVGGKGSWQASATSTGSSEASATGKGSSWRARARAWAAAAKANNSCKMPMVVVGSLGDCNVAFLLRLSQTWLRNDYVVVIVVVVV